MKKTFKKWLGINEVMGRINRMDEDTKNRDLEFQVFLVELIDALNKKKNPMDVIPVISKLSSLNIDYKKIL